MLRSPSSLLCVVLVHILVAAVYGGVTLRGHVESRLAVSGNGAVSKRAVSSKMRLVFAVGLEGSGHNYLAKALLTMFHEQQGKVTRLDECRMSWDFYLVRSMTASPDTYDQALARAREGMRSLAEKAENLTSLSSASSSSMGGIATMFQLDSPHECKYIGMLSYPNFVGDDKVFRYTDLRMLAEVAEEEGVDLRVVYLQRPARDMMIANTVHRDFHNQLGKGAASETKEERYMRYSRVLFTDIAVMQSMLSELGPGFTVCHRFEKIGQREQATKVADFIAPNSEVSGMVVDVLVGTVKQHDGNATTREDLLLPGAEGLAERLQHKLDAFEHLYCRPA